MDKMLGIEGHRIEEKLKVWETPGFLGFINDLQKQKGVECNIMGEVETLKRIYLKRLSEISPKSKYVQGKMF